MVSNSNTLVTVTERGADGCTTVLDHIFEKKGCKITVQFNILDEARLESQLESQVKHAAEEALKIKSIRDRLGASVTYLEGLSRIGDVVKDVSRSSQTRSPTDHKYSRRSTRLSAFP